MRKRWVRARWRRGCQKNRVLEADAGRPDGPDAATSHRIAGLEERIAAEIQKVRMGADGRCAGGPDEVRYLFIAGCPLFGNDCAHHAPQPRRTDPARPGALSEDSEGPRAISFQRGRLLQSDRARDVVGDALPARDRASGQVRGLPGAPVALAQWERAHPRRKAPYYFRQLERLGRVFPQARFVVLVRDLHEVARSYRDRAANPADALLVGNDHRLAVRDWGESLQHARAVGPRRRPAPACRLCRFFFGAADVNLPPLPLSRGWS